MPPLKKPHKAQWLIRKSWLLRVTKVTDLTSNYFEISFAILIAIRCPLLCLNWYPVTITWSIMGCNNLTDQQIPAIQKYQNAIRQYLNPPSNDVSFLHNLRTWCFQHCTWKCLAIWPFFCSVGKIFINWPLQWSTILGRLNPWSCGKVTHIWMQSKVFFFYSL